MKDTVAEIRKEFNALSRALRKLEKNQDQNQFRDFSDRLDALARRTHWRLCATLSTRIRELEREAGA